MSEALRMRILAALSVATVLATLLSLERTALSIPACMVNADCGCFNTTNCTAEGQGGYCFNATCQCNPGYAAPFCQPTGACCGVSEGAQAPAAVAPQPCAELTQQQCANLNGTYAGDLTSCTSGICDPAATATATATITPTATGTPVPQGGGCTDASQCVPGLSCTDDVCCDTACDGPEQSCNLPGQVGTCASVAAPAPAASSGGLLAMLGVLLAVGAAAMALRTRGTN